MKFRIDEKGWKGFSGNMGTALFVDGIAEIASNYEALRIGSLVRLVEIDDDGNELRIASPTQEMVETRGLSAEVVAYHKHGVEPEEGDKEAVVEDETPVVEVVRYTEDQLSALADKGGIAALREIAGPLGVKGTSIAGLIDEILALRGTQ